jgi:hypothetical protein
MNNAYRPFPELKYNREDLLKKLQENTVPWKQYGTDPYNAIFTQLVDAADIVSQFKPGLISNEVKFAKMLAGGGAGCHTDTRHVGILIPVQVEPGQVTIIHESQKASNSPENLNIDGDEKVKIFENPKEIDRFYLDQPYFLNTHVPHSVVVKSSVDRIILTLGFVTEYDDWDTIMKLYENGELLV